MTPKLRIGSENHKDDLIKVFIYGTLKKNEPNHYHLVERGAKFMCKAVTVEKWPLIIGTVANIPFLLNKKDSGKVFDSSNFNRKF